MPEEIKNPVESTPPTDEDEEYEVSLRFKKINPTEKTPISRRDFLKGMAVGGVGVGATMLLGGNRVVETLMTSSGKEKYEEEVHEVMGEIDNFVDINANTEFWDQFRSELEAKSTNFDVYHTSTGGDLTRNAHAYDWFMEGDKSGRQDASVLIIDPDGQTYKSRAVMISVALTDEGRLGNVPSSITERTLPVEQVEDKMREFFKFPDELIDTPWEDDHSRRSTTDTPMHAVWKRATDKRGFSYRAEASSRGNMTLTIWHPEQAGRWVGPKPKPNNEPKPTERPADPDAQMI